MSGTGKTYVTRSAWRSEMDMTSSAMKKDPKPAKAMGGQTAFRMVMLGKLSEPGVSVWLNERTKTFARIDAAEMAQNLPKEEKKWSVTRLGTDHVAGLPCENVRAVEEGKKGEIELCVTKEIASGQWRGPCSDSTAELRGSG